MALSTPTGLLILAVLVGQAAGFAKVPKDAAESGDLRASRTFSTGGSICAGPDISEWRDMAQDGCDWYAENDPGCKIYMDYGQITNCPVTCNPGCVQSFLCGAGTVWRDGKCEQDGVQPSCAIGTKLQDDFSGGLTCRPDLFYICDLVNQGAIRCCEGGKRTQCCARRGFKPGPFPAARLRALPATPPAPRPAAGARRGARRATRSHAAARRGEDVVTGREDGPGVSPALQTPGCRV